MHTSSKHNLYVKESYLWVKLDLECLRMILQVMVIWTISLPTRVSTSCLDNPRHRSKATIGGPKSRKCKLGSIQRVIPSHSTQLSQHYYLQHWQKSKSDPSSDEPNNHRQRIRTETFRSRFHFIQSSIVCFALHVCCNAFAFTLYHLRLESNAPPPKIVLPTK